MEDNNQEEAKEETKEKGNHSDGSDLGLPSESARVRSRKPKMKSPSPSEAMSNDDEKAPASAGHRQRKSPAVANSTRSVGKSPKRLP